MEEGRGAHTPAFACAAPPITDPGPHDGGGTIPFWTDFAACNRDERKISCVLCCYGWSACPFRSFCSSLCARTTF